MNIRIKRLARLERRVGRLMDQHHVFQSRLNRIVIDPMSLGANISILVCGGLLLSKCTAAIPPPTPAPPVSEHFSDYDKYCYLLEGR